MSSQIMTRGFLYITALLHFLILFLPNSVYCVRHSPLVTLPPTQVPEEDKKTRLGSSPPSCHNRCNACNPCTAVQAPTLPSPTGQLVRREPADQSAYSQDNSNYKAMGWKCRCGDRLYIP